jgi:hypothetical protein
LGWVFTRPQQPTVQLPAATSRFGSVVHSEHTAVVADLGPLRIIHMMAFVQNCWPHP